MIAALLLACATPKVPPVPPVVGTTTADTGVESPSPVTTGGPDTRTFLPPSARIISTADIDVSKFVTLFPAHGTDPGVILFHAQSTAFGNGTELASAALAVRGGLPPGDHEVTAVWDGVSMIPEGWWWDAVVNAGDVDRDGHLDLWFGRRLVRGPLLKGRQLDGLPEDVLATIHVEEIAIAADFDADGDGEIDLITQATNGQRAFVRYGPFSGAIPSAVEGVADPATYSSLGETDGCQADWTAQWLSDHLGPGHDAVAIGVDLEVCEYDTFVWDPFVPRGTHLTFNQALAVLTRWSNFIGDVFVHDPGDVDRDGHPDVIYEYTDHAQLIPGPLSGIYDTSTDFGFWDQMLNGYPGRAMGDVNGDGAPEILGRWQWPVPDSTAGTIRQTWVLMCSPFTFPLDFSTGIPLVEHYELPIQFSSFIGLDSVDLDGDGLHDLVDTRVNLEGVGEPDGLSIWYGKDLAAACAAQSTSIR